MKLLYTALGVRCNALSLGNLTGAIKHSFTGHFINYTCPPHTTAPPPYLHQPEPALQDRTDLYFHVVFVTFWP